MSWTKEEEAVVAEEYRCDEFARRRGDYKYVCRKLGTAFRLSALAEILDLYVRRVKESRNLWVKWSEADLEFELDDGPKKRLIRSARAELLRLKILIPHPDGKDSKGVLTCRVNFDLIRENRVGWTKGWRDTVKAKPRGRSMGDRAKSAAAEPSLFDEAVYDQEDTDADQDRSAVVADDKATEPNLWEPVKERLAGELGPVAMNNWLSGTEFASLDEGTLTVEVPNPATAAWIEQEYGGVINKAVAELKLPFDKVNFRVKSAEVVPGQFWPSAGAEQSPFQSSSGVLPLREEIPEEKLASQLTKLTQSHKPDEQTVRNMNRAFAQLEPSLRGEALGQFAAKIAGYGKRTNIGGGILFNDAKAVCAGVVREHQPFYYFEFATLEQAKSQMAADEREAAKHPERAELLQKRPWMPQPIPFPRGTPQFLAEFERLFRTIPRKFMGREQRARGGLSIAVSV